VNQEIHNEELELLGSAIMFGDPKKKLPNKLMMDIVQTWVARPARQ
jgi:hypothetical protein